jgi:hypothetical protein
MKTAVLWDVATCSMVETYRSFRVDIASIIGAIETKYFRPEDGGCKHL